MAVVVTADASPPAAWSDLLAVDPGADYFHAPTWTRLTARHLPGGRPRWLLASLDGRPAGGLAAVVHGGRLVRVHSSAHGCSGGPLLATGLAPADQRRVVAALVDAALALRGRLGTCGIALNAVHEERWGARLAGDPRFRRTDTTAAVVPLEGDEDQLAGRLRRSKRKERDRALRRGATAAVSRDPADLAAYHAIHVRACARWGVAPQPLDLLQELVAAPPDPGGGAAWFVCVRAGEEVVGGHLNLQRGEWVTAWNGVTEPAHARTLYPATLAVWTDMVEARRRGARWLDLGASAGSASLAFFKDGFGAQTRPRGWYVADTAAAALLRRLRRLAGRDRSVAARARWHDEAPR